MEVLEAKAPHIWTPTGMTGPQLAQVKDLVARAQAIVATATSVGGEPFTKKVLSTGFLGVFISKATRAGLWTTRS